MTEKPLGPKGRQLARRRERYATDPEYAERVRQRSRDRRRAARPTVDEAPALPPEGSEPPPPCLRGGCEDPAAEGFRFCGVHQWT